MAGRLPEKLGHPFYVGDEPSGDDPASQQKPEVEDEAVRAPEGARAEGPPEHRRFDGHEQHVAADGAL
jgi:hypothetical protein